MATVPCPGSDISSNRPPWASINCRASGRPSPCRRSKPGPSGPTFSPPSARASPVGSMPAPWSEITIRAQSWPRRRWRITSSRIRPPLGLAAMALSIRCPSARASRRGSPLIDPAPLLPRRSRLTPASFRRAPRSSASRVRKGINSMLSSARGSIPASLCDRSSTLSICSVSRVRPGSPRHIHAQTPTARRPARPPAIRQSHRSRSVACGIRSSYWRGTGS